MKTLNNLSREEIIDLAVFFGVAIATSALILVIIMALIRRHFRKQDAIEKKVFPRPASKPDHGVNCVCGRCK